jgi:hypothetical protein
MSKTPGVVGQACQAAEHRGGERAQQQIRAEQRVSGADLLRRSDEDANDAREQAGHRPHRERHTPHRDAGELRGVPVVGGGARRETDRRTSQEHGKGGDREWCDGEHEEVLRREMHRADVERDMERQWIEMRREATLRDEAADRTEELSEADGRDEHDES